MKQCAEMGRRSSGFVFCVRAKQCHLNLPMILLSLKQCCIVDLGPKWPISINF